VLRSGSPQASRPLSPRPETEWWTEQLIIRLRERFGEKPFTLMDLCSGSGAIGLSILKAFPNAHVSFGEIMSAHVEQIQKNIEVNNLDASRADIRKSDLFAAWPGARWNVIVTNPPYIPDTRELDTSVANFEPAEALYGGPDGLVLIDRIVLEAPLHLEQDGEVWLEADISNIEEAAGLFTKNGAKERVILTDPYDRQRVVVSYYP
jgi:release factor glutamine methyltransferase